ncbi:MAG TPA: calcium-binding protein [Lysobacter sp.]|nr:calcium-binding protein [Lysobacter sp.]
MSWICWNAVLAVCLLLSMPAHSADRSIDDGITAASELIRSQAGEHRLLLLGEKHGTREIPVLVRTLVSNYADGAPVVLGLEVPHGEHGALKSYMDSDGGVAARSRLQSTSFWSRADDQHDGRRSHDMLDLVEALRMMRRSGHDVAVLPYDLAPDDARDHHARDEAMADTLRAAFASMPVGRLIVLTGNVHAMLEKPRDAPPQMQRPMGSYLRDLDPFSVDIVARQGEFWACIERCGPVKESAGAHHSQGDGSGIWDFRIVLPRFSVARLIGADPAGEVRHDKKRIDRSTPVP